MKRVLFLCSVCIPGLLSAQLELTATGLTVTTSVEDFTGAGFQPGGGGGTLDSDLWSAEGFSTGGVDFGGTALTGDMARGIAALGTVTTGGIYSLPVPAPNKIWVQPTADDFTPGSLTLRLLNGTPSMLGQLVIQYVAFASNDEDRSNSLVCAFSPDNITYTEIPGSTFVSPELMDLLYYEEAFELILSGLSIAPGDEFYIRWTGDDVGGAGSRDEFGLNGFAFTGYEAVATPEFVFSDSSITVPESAGAVSFEVTLTESSDCTLSLGYDPASTATPAFDYGLTGFVVEFTAGGATTIEVPVGIVDDLETEITELGIIYVTDISGACVAGVPDAINIYIEDNDAIVPPIASFTTVGLTETESVGTVSGTIALSEADDCVLQMYLDAATTMTNGLDYSFLLPTFITFTAGGATEFTFDIPIIDDTEVEASEMLLMNIIPWTGACITAGITDFEIWIEDNDVASIPDVSFVVESDSKAESAGSVTTNLVLSESADCTVEITASPASTATNGLDYSLALPAEIVFTAGGSTVASVVASILEDAEIESAETIVLQMAVTAGSCVAGDIMEHTITITDNDNVSVQETQAAGITVAPNPVRDQLLVQSPVMMDVIHVTDMQGRLVLTITANTNFAQIDISQLPSGNYVVRIDAAGKSYQQFIQKQ